MPVVECCLSKKQKSKLRNGHSVRLKKGQGVCLVVEPEKYSIINRSFGKNKAITIQLSPKEILANREGNDPFQDRETTPEEAKDNLLKNEELMKGKGLFDDLRKGATKLVKKATKEAKKGVEVATKTVAKSAGELAPELGATAGASLGMAGATALGQPQLAPMAGMMGSAIGQQLGNQIRENTRQIEVEQPRGYYQRALTLEAQNQLNRGVQDYNRRTGQNLDYQTNSGLSHFESNLYRQGINAQQVSDLYGQRRIDGQEPLTAQARPLNRYVLSNPMRGYGMDTGRRYGGNGLNIGNGIHQGRGIYAGREQMDRRGVYFGHGNGGVRQKNSLVPSLARLSRPELEFYVSRNFI